MASNVRCFFFLLLALSICLQAHARDSKFFSKVTKENKESISISPTQTPTLAPSPSPEPEVVEHGYGLYSQEESYQNYEYPPTTTNPTETEKFGEEKFVPAEELSKNNFKEFGMGYSNDNFNGNGYGTEKQGMSDTRFLENGKYYHDINQDFKDESSFYNGNGYVTEKQGMSDTRFLENGKYFHANNEEGVTEGKIGHFNTNNYENEKFEEEKNGHFNTNYYVNENEKFEEEKYGHFNTNNYENENENEYEKYQAEKQGMSDTRFLENGRYYYDPKNDHGVGDVGFHNNNNVEFANSYRVNRNGNGNGNGNGKNEYEREADNYHGNEYHVKEGRGGYNSGRPKKFPNEYDTMEEYDREQGYFNGHEDEYVP